VRASAVAGPPTRDEVRRRATEVFAQPPFQRHFTLLERIMNWISRHLGFTAQAGTGQFSALGRFISWLLVVVVVAVLVAVAVIVIRRWSPRAKQDGDDLDIEITDERSTDEWRAEADRFEADGQWKQALRARYRELVGELVDRAILAPLPGRTTGEFRVDVADAAPQVADAFGAASLLFELAWYANEPTGASELRRFGELSARVLDGARRPVGAGAS